MSSYRIIFESSGDILPPESHASRHPALHALGVVIWNPDLESCIPQFLEAQKAGRNRLGQPKV